MIKIFDHYFHKRTLLQILLDFGLVLGILVVAINAQAAAPLSRSSIAAAVLMSLTVLAINAGLGFYQRTHTRTVGQTRARALLSWCLLLPLAYGIFRLAPGKLESGKMFLLILMGGVALMLARRVHVAHHTPRDLMCQRVLIFGTGARAKMVGRSLQESDPNVELVGYYASPSESVLDSSGSGILSTGRSLPDIANEYKIDEIVVALAERRGGSLPLRELLDCKLQGVRVLDLATHFEQTLGQIRLDSVSAGWLIFGDGFGQGLMREVNKRIFDIVCATILIVLALPVMLATAVLIKLESTGPVLYRQERVGLNGRLFKVVKFRSMRTDAEKDGKPRWATASDDRVTRVGRVIRKLRIDELPQLFGVLGGSMSLVGPRPERPYFVDKLTQEIPYFAVRQSVKPGVTGWAQVRYQYGASVEDAAEKLQYDLYYVKNHTLLLDLVVLFETVGVVLMRKGAQ